MTAAMAAALTVLTEALDDPDTDIAHSLQTLTVDAAAAIATYNGLSVIAPQSDPPLTVTMLTVGTVPGDVRTSLQFRLPGRDGPGKTSAVVIILYAGQPGAFVDLAVDLAWLTALSPSDFVLDQHVAFAAEPIPKGQLHVAATINQAIGVLIGRGHTPQQADWELDTQASNTRTDRHTVARRILAKIPTGGDDDAGQHQGPNATA